MIHVKICGIAEPAGFDAAVAAGADYLGFVLFARSPRAVTPAQAAALSGRYAGGPARVGLFVKPDDAAVEAALAALPLDVLQVYASAADCAALARRFGLPIWRAVGVAASLDLPSAADGAAGFVIEPRAPADATRPGGLGLRLDVGLLSGWRAPAPWLLAGGLTPDTVDGAIRRARPPGVDVSSGVESAPGVKDPARIAAFVAAVRAADTP